MLHGGGGKKVCCTHIKKREIKTLDDKIAIFEKDQGEVKQQKYSIQVQAIKRNTQNPPEAHFLSHTNVRACAPTRDGTFISFIMRACYSLSLSPLPPYIIRPPFTFSKVIRKASLASSKSRFRHDLAPSTSAREKSEKLLTKLSSRTQFSGLSC